MGVTALKATSLNSHSFKPTETVQTEVGDLRQAPIANLQTKPVEDNSAPESPKAPKNRKELKIALAGLGVGRTICYL